MGESEKAKAILKTCCGITKKQPDSHSRNLMYLIVVLLNEGRFEEAFEIDKEMA